MALFALAALALQSAVPAQVATILAKFEAAKPSEKALAFYSLDWATSLQDARTRAAKEHRPIFLILNTNITAGTNFYSGHT